MSKRLYSSFDEPTRCSPQPTSSSNNVTVVRRVHGGIIDTDSIDSAKDDAKPSLAAFDIVLISIAICMLIGGLYFGFRWWQEEKKTADITQLWDDVKDVANNDGDSDGVSWGEGYSRNPIDREINWDDLKAINNDIYAWIYIPDTNIDYPVMMEQKFGSYFYLDHDVYKQSFVSGCIFIPKEPDWFHNDDAHLLVFGHNMRNGTMFSSLREYKDKDFYKSHPYVYVYYPDRTEQWEIWTAYHTAKTDIIYNLPYEFNTDDYRTLLSNMASHGFYNTNITSVDASQKVMTLSTCDNLDQSGTGRFVVNTVKVETKIIE